MIYCKIESGIVTDRAVFDTPMPANWPEYNTFVQNDEAQTGWTYANGVFTAPPPEVVLPSMPTVVDANMRLDAGVLASLQTAVQASEIVHAIPTNFTAQNFAQLLTQMKIVCDAFVSMLQAHTTTSGADPSVLTARPQ